MTEFRPCLVAPVFNHGASAVRLMEFTADMGVIVFLVDDGSTCEQREVEECARFPHVQILRHKENMGKGAAVMTGLRAAHSRGFSHALQIDADGQHALGDIQKFLSISEEQPNTVVCGQPEFDESVPMNRLVGRYLTHVWVWMETLSFEIKDSMCGFRVYPLQLTLAAVAGRRLGMRMDFDCEVLVRLSWAGVAIRFVQTKVVYPEGGRSNFRLFSDNWLITLMHTRLVIGMLWRLPTLLVRKLG